MNKDNDVENLSMAMKMIMIFHLCGRMAFIDDNENSDGSLSGTPMYWSINCAF